MLEGEGLEVQRNGYYLLLQDDFTVKKFVLRVLGETFNFDLSNIE